MHPDARRPDSMRAFSTFTSARLLASMVAVHVSVSLADVDATTELTPVLVTGHYDNGVSTSDAASQGVITGALLQDIPLLRPGEVLEAIPGLVVTQHSGEGKANQYFLRGYNLDHGTDFATSVDGVPVNMPTNGHGQGYTDINFLIPELVERIEYRKGPYFASNGDFSSAGSADIHYRDVLDTSLFDTTVGEYGYRRLLAASSAPVDIADDELHLLGAAEGVEENGPWANPDGMRKVNSLFRLSEGNASRGGSVDAIVYAAHWNSTDQVPLQSIDDGTLCRYCAVDPSDGGRSARQILSGEWHEYTAAGYTKYSLYAEHYRLQLWSNFTYFENDPVRGDQFNQRDARNLAGGSFIKGWQHDLAGHESITEVGFQVRHDFIHVSLFDSQSRVAFETISDNLVDETEAGAYVQNTTIWSNWFRTLIGLREDTIRLDLTSQTFAANSGRASDSRVSPKASFIFGPWEKTEFFVNAGNGFHSNDARGVIYQYDPVSGQSVDRAPALVGSFGKEIGVRSEFVPNLQSSIAIWSLNSASELVYSADSGGTEINGASVRTGVEWSNHYALNNWLFIDADMAATHARFADYNANGERGDHIPNAVGEVASLGFSIHDINGWFGDIKTRYIGSYPLSQDGALRAPAAAITNLRIARTLSSRVTVLCDLLNVFDRAYYDIAYEQDFRLTPNAPIVPNGITVHSGEPRQIRVSLKLLL
jgi:TonB-dependent receptor-like protein